jgi:hypothetical protein
MAILRREFVDDKLLQEFLDVLEVGHIATGADNRVFADWVQPLNVLKTGKRAV